MIRRVGAAWLLMAAASLLAQSTPSAQPVQSGSAAPPASTVSGSVSASQPAAKDSGKKAAKASKEVDVTTGGPVKAGTVRAQRKAAKLYMAGVKLLEKQQPEMAWDLLKEASSLEPDNSIYVRAAELARQSAVTQLVQQASRDKSRAEAGEGPNDAAKLLQHALDIDPESPAVQEHLSQLAGMADAGPVGITAVSAQAPETPLADGPIRLEPSKDKHSFHIRSSERQVALEVFRGYGIQALIHDSVESKQVRLDVDDATFAQATNVLGLVTHTFYEALDPHRVVVARDTRENRTQLMRQDTETVYMPGLSDKDLKSVSDLARNVFNADKAVDEPTRGTMTIKAPTRSMDAFNRTVGELEDGSNQLDLNVKVIELTHVSDRETGATLLQQTGVSNAYSEINSIINQNQTLVQQIITSGLVPNASTLNNEIEIIGILLASGQLTGTVFNQGFALFGNGISSSLLSPSPATLTFSVNSSDTRVLDDIHMRLQDDEAGTFKIGERYPIETSSYSSVALPTVSGLSTSAITAAAESQTVPQIQYEDIGLTLKATPKVLRSNDVAITLELKIESLGGSSLNDIPILNSQQFAGVLTMRNGETAVLVSDLSKQESKAMNGLPGIGDIPGLQDVNDIVRSQNVARLLILVTPSVLRGPKQMGHGPMLIVDKSSGAH